MSWYYVSIYTWGQTQIVLVLRCFASSVSEDLSLTRSDKAVLLCGDPRSGLKVGLRRNKEMYDLPLIT